VGRLTEKQLTILTVIVALMITGIFGFLVYRDLGAIDEEEQRIEAVNAQIRIAEIEIQKMKLREEDVIVNREVVKRDSAILPDESEINQFINLIGDFEKRSGVLVTEIKGLSGIRRTRGKGKPTEAILRIPMQLKLLGSMEQFLQFVNFFENHDRFVRISNFSVRQAMGQDKKGPARHDISLDFETYQYNARGGPISQVDLPNYERRVEDPNIQKRIRLYKPAHIEKYQLKTRLSRRDPLVDPREAAQKEDPDGTDPEERFKQEKQLLDDLALQLSLLQDDLRFEEQLRKEGQIMRLGPITKLNTQRINQLEFRVSEVLTNKSITIPELKEEFLAKVVRPFEEEKEKRSTEPTEILVTRQQVLDYLRRLTKLFEEREFRKVVEAHEGFLRLIEGKKLMPDAEELRRDMEKLAHDAEVINKFNQEPLSIKGVILDSENGSFAYINDQILREGDSVDAAGKITIQKILSDEIEFDYEGVSIIRSLRGGK
jgi:Tfp pilus assembly protein PilO